MRIALRLALGCALAALLPSAFAKDVSGDWKGSFEFQGSTIPLTIHLIDVNGAVSGTVEGLPTSPTTIKDGKLVGDALTFDVDTDYQGQTYELLYSGKVTADTIEFNFGTKDGSWNTEMTAERSIPEVAADINGDWSGAFDFQGTSVPLTFHLMNTGGAVTGSVEGLPTSPTEIHDGKVTANALTFWVDTDYQGQTYRLDYTGKITPDHIDFSFGTDDGSWGTTMTAMRTSAQPMPVTTPAAPATTSAPSAAPQPANTSTAPASASSTPQ
jgi:hypothetical protein